MDKLPNSSPVHAEEPLYHEHLFAQLYDAQCPWSPDRSFCLNLANGRRSVLDLGCGTGSLAAAMARAECKVTAVDPAQAMLDQAVHHEGHEQVQWVRADARHVRLGQSFDLIVMTGHAFQCLLTAEEQLALLRTIAAHLAPDGTFIFDTRNPMCEEWLQWTPEKSRHIFRHPTLGDVESWDDCVFDPVTQIVTYEWFYRLQTGEVAHAPASRIAFPSRTTLAALIAQAGLQVDQWLGDWECGAISDSSLEIIPVGSLAASIP